MMHGQKNISLSNANLFISLKWKCEALI